MPLSNEVKPCSSVGQLTASSSFRTFIRAFRALRIPLASSTFEVELANTSAVTNTWRGTRLLADSLKGLRFLSYKKTQANRHRTE